MSLDRQTIGIEKKNFVAVVVALGVNVAFVVAWQPVVWSGTWTSRGEDVEIVRMVSGSGTARGWKGFVEALLATRSYRIVIAHTADRIAISFPGDASNVLTLREMPIDSGPSVRVVGRGEWWTKHITSAHSDSAELVVASATFSGWWRNGSPEKRRRNRRTSGDGLFSNEADSLTN